VNSSALAARPDSVAEHDTRCVVVRTRKVMTTFNLDLKLLEELTKAADAPWRKKG
jgi:hypothetical protein